MPPRRQGSRRLASPRRSDHGHPPQRLHPGNLKLIAAFCTTDSVRHALLEVLFGVIEEKWGRSLRSPWLQESDETGSTQNNESFGLATRSGEAGNFQRRNRKRASGNDEQQAGLGAAPAQDLRHVRRHEANTNRCNRPRVRRWCTMRLRERLSKVMQVLESVRSTGH